MNKNDICIFKIYNDKCIICLEGYHLDDNNQCIKNKEGCKIQNKETKRKLKNCI